MASDADRDLLFGLLALQNGLINQGELVAAFQAWTLDKAKPLADHLVDRGTIDADDRSAVESMVDRHLKKHGGDAEQSLASVPAGRSTREKLGALEDPDLDATLARVASTSTEPDADATASYSVGSSSTDGLRFRVLRPHARGGLGAVFVALDGELNREVALKEILDRHADDASSRRRFLVEAEITGGLEHPGIVPVYGLGAYEDGRPFYAMRFIHGDSLKHAIATFHDDPTLKADPARRSLELRKLLRRFTDICNAIEYAHSRGVLHRDIKPGNVIVGKHGETLVVDWGLAKAIGRAEGAEPAEERTLIPSSASGSAETLPGKAIGTPAYMSPEQARGDLDALGPSSDVYGLGATLYALLSGRAPFEGDDLGAIVGRVQRGEFPPPRQIDPAIDPPLEAICLKAMALDPSRRYPSSRALADDLDRWLADEPVSAYPEPWARALSRWVARRRTAVVGSAAALLVGLIGLGAVAAVQTGARADLDRKNGELTRVNARLADSNAALDLQRQRAEAREEQAIDAVKRFRDAVADNPILKNSPELEDLRKTLLKEPLAFFKDLREHLQDENDTRPESLAQLAEAIHDYAHLTDEIGDPRDGLKAHDDSLAIWEQLARAEPSNPDYQSGLAMIKNCRGNFLLTTGDVESARRSFESALAIRRRLAEEQPAVTKYQRDLAASHDSLGILLGETGDVESARRSYDSALAIFHRLEQENPAVTEYRGARAIIHNKLGILMRDTGDVESARRSFESALALRRRLTEDDPTVTEYQADLAASYNNFGILQHDTGDVESARRSFESALAINQRLAEEHPGVPEHASILGGTLNNLAKLDLNAGRFAEARDRLREAVTRQKTALAANPRDPTYHRFLRNHFRNLRRAAQGLDDAELLAEADRGLAELQASDPEFQALEARLAAVLDGDAPDDNAERLALALHGYNTRRFAVAARLWAEALDDDPALAASRQDQHAYNASCAAALAADGQGTDAPEDDDARKALRGRALGWLRDELDLWSTMLDDAEGDDAQSEAIAATLRHWQADPDLASIRDPDALAQRTQDEREGFAALWRDVAGRLEQDEGIPGASRTDPSSEPQPDPEHRPEDAP
jgi:serine/threonine-protein kinase